MKNLQVTVNDDVATLETLHKYKRWFNGVKHFFTVKPLPPTGGWCLKDGKWVRDTPKKPSEDS